MVTAVPLSISNSSDRIPRNGAIVSLLVGLTLSIFVFGIIELRLRQIGIKPNVHDAKELWAYERGRASALGDKSLIIVGDSRAQVDLDLPTLANSTGLEPIQLAIDGSQFMAVLDDLANDPKITGTILVGAETWKLLPHRGKDRSNEFVSFYNNEYRGKWGPMVEAKIKGLVQSWSVFYSSGIPLSLLFPMLINKDLGLKPSYLTMHSSRQRDADYNLVKQPNFYIARVLRHLGNSHTIDFSNIRSETEFIHEVLNKLAEEPRAAGIDAAMFEHVNKLINRILDRQAKIIFVRFPSSALIWEIDKYRSPRASYWDHFAASTRARTFHFSDFKDLQFQLPDGSHLDVRDKVAFTKALAKILRDSNAI